MSQPRQKQHNEAVVCQSVVAAVLNVCEQRTKKLDDDDDDGERERLSENEELRPFLPAVNLLREKHRRTELNKYSWFQAIAGFPAISVATRTVKLLKSEDLFGQLKNHHMLIQY